MAQDDIKEPIQKIFLLAVFGIPYITRLNILPLMNNIFPPSPRKRVLHHTKLFFKLYLFFHKYYRHTVMLKVQEKTGRLKHKNKLPF